MNKRILITFTLQMIASLSYGQLQKAKDIDIVDIRKLNTPIPDRKYHQHHDAVMYRTSAMSKGDSYVLVYYQMEGDSIRYHKAIYNSKDVMNKAAYVWRKDTIVLRMYNVSTKRDIKFKAWGYGATSAMDTDE
ncbi:MAG: hypothetical protein WCG87_11810 [Bacteroidota bacterium]